MEEIRRILMPTDFSRGAGQALRYAVALAERLGAELHLLHVATGRTSDEAGSSAAEACCAEMRAEALHVYNELRRPGQESDLSIRCAVLRDTEAYRAILAYSGDQQIDLIVMAPYGRPHGGRFIVGSTAEKVVRLASCDVLTSGLRGLYIPDRMRRILVPVDFSSHSALALERARRLAKQARAHLTVLHVVGATVFPGEDADSAIIDTRRFNEAYTELEQFYESTKGPNVPHVFSVMRGRPADRIAHFAERHHIHLIVQGSHGRSGIEYAMLGSVAEVVVRLAPCPVLTVRTPARASLPDAPGDRARIRREEPLRAPAVPKTSLKADVVA